MKSKRGMISAMSEPDWVSVTSKEQNPPDIKLQIERIR